MSTTVRSRGVGTPGSRKRGRKKSKVREMLLAALLTMFLVSTYLEVPFYITSTLFVPAFFTLLFLVPVLMVVYHRRIYKYEALFAGQVFLVLLLTALLSPGFEYLDQKLLGLLQTMASIVSGILLLKLIRDLPARLTARILLALSLMLLVGASLEVVGLLRGVSDAFRETVYGGEGSYFVYNADERDAGITGFTRPKFFTSEPSLLAIGFFVFVNSWLVLSHNRKNLVMVCIGTLLMIVMTGSLVLALSLFVTLSMLLYQEKSVVAVGTTALLVGSASLLLMFATPDLISSLLERVANIFESGSVLYPGSEQVRLIFPFITMIDVLLASPIFGVGISGKEVIERYSSLPLDPELALGTNVLAMLFIYLGVVGVFLFVGVFHIYWRKLRIRQVALLAILILALSQMMGGFETPRFWGYTFLFIAVLHKRARDESVEPVTSEGNTVQKKLSQRL